MNIFSKIAKLSLIFILLLSIAAQSVDVSAKKDTNAQGLDIRERLNKPEMTIIDYGEILDEQKEFEINSIFLLNFKWSITDDDAANIKENDFFIFNLPESLIISEKLETVLSKFAQVEIFENIHVKITFTDQVSQYSNVFGNISFSAGLNPKIITKPQDITLDIKSNQDKKINFSVIRSESEDYENINTNLIKDGLNYEGIDPDGIIWNVVVNRNYNEINNFKLSSYIDEQLIHSGIKVFKVDYDLNHILLENRNELDESFYSHNGGELEFNAIITQPLLISFKTAIIDSRNISFDNNQEQFFSHNFYNSINVNNDNSFYDIELDKELTFNKHLNINLLDMKNNTYLFEIDYNLDNKKLEKPEIENNFSKELIFAKESLEIREHKSNKAVDNYKVEESLNGFVIAFDNNLSNAYKIIYKLKLEENLNSESNLQIFSEAKVTLSDESQVEAYVEFQPIDKTLDFEEVQYNYSDKTISQDFIINKQSNEFDALSLNIAFQNKGLKMQTDNFKIIDIDNDCELQKSDYKIVANNENGISVNIKDNPQIKNSSLLVRYVVAYDINSIKKDEKLDITIGVKINYTQFGEFSHSQPVDLSSINQSVYTNRYLNRSYDARSKNITWEIIANYNKDKNDNLKVVADIFNNQNFVSGSVEVAEYKLANDGELIFIRNLNKSEFEVKLEDCEDNREVHIKITNSAEKVYKVNLTSSLRNRIINDKYNNQVKVETINNYTINDDLFIKYGGIFIDEISEVEKDEVRRTVEINASQSYIEEAVVSATVSIEQEILKDSFVLYPTIPESTGIYTTDYSNPLLLDQDFKVTINKENHIGKSFKLNFLNKENNSIDKTYVLRYYTKVVDSSIGSILKSEVWLNDFDSKKQSLIFKPLSNKRNEIMGESFGSQGNYQILKVDQRDIPIEGVVFELLHLNTNRVYQAQTNYEGRLSFDNLIYGDYLLKEVSTAEGFVIDDNLYTGIKITINKNTSDLNKVKKVINKRNKLKICNKNKNKESLNGSSYTLERKVDGKFILINNKLKVDDFSLIEGLIFGEYRLTQNVAPKGYILNTSPLLFIIDFNDNNQALDKEVVFTNYQGLVEISNIDDTEHILVESFNS